MTGRLVGVATVLALPRTLRFMADPGVEEIEVGFGRGRVGR